MKTFGFALFPDLGFPRDGWGGEEGTKIWILNHALLLFSCFFTEKFFMCRKSKNSGDEGGGYPLLLHSKCVSM